MILMFLPGAIFYILFKYVPMFGLIIAFKDYRFNAGMLHSKWVGLKYFQILFNNPQMVHIIINTLRLSVLTLIVGFPFPIIIALMLNEVRKSWFKRSVQTLIFFPHFFSWVIAGGMVLTIFSQESGSLNIWMDQLLGHTFPFLYSVPSWVAIYLGAGIWKEAGFGAIIYLAALSSIDPELYDAAVIDGANKWRQMWNITLPGINSVIVIMLLLSIGTMMEISFDQIFIMGNPVVSSVSTVIGIWVYRIGLQGGQFSLTTAMGLFESTVSLILIVVANQIARRFGNEIW